MSTELLEKMLAKRDTQMTGIPEQSDSGSVVDENVEMDTQVTHEEPTFTNDSGNEESEQDTYAQPDETEAQEQAEPPAEKSDWEQKFDTLEKQRADNQSYYQHQINELKMKLDAQNQPAPEPEAKSLTDEELNDMFWDNPAEAMRIARGSNSAQPINQNLAIQEGIQREMHADYDEMVQLVRSQTSSNPQLEQEIMGSPNPAKAAYEKGLTFKSAQLITTDPAAYEAELRKKWEAEQSSQTKMPSRVGATRGATPVHNKTKVAEEGTAFQNMFGRKRR